MKTYQFIWRLIRYRSWNYLGSLLGAIGFFVMDGSFWLNITGIL